MSGMQMQDRLAIQIGEDLLIQCARATPDHDAIRDLLARPEFEWDQFWSLAASQHIQPLVAHVLACPTLGDVLPPDARSATKAARLQTTLNNMAIHAELQAIGARLNQHGIPVVPLKGTHLAQRIFSSLDARRCGDIDILVPEGQWDTAHQLLVEAGYRPAGTVNPGVKRHAFHGVPLVRVAHGRAFVVELHRQLTDPRCLTIDYTALWERIAAAECEPGQLPGLPTEELLVFLAIHAPKHDTGVLRLFADIDHLIAREGESIDWDNVVNIANDWHASAMLYFVLTLARSLLSTPASEEALRRLRPPGWKRVIVPLLVDTHAILRPPMPAHLRANRFRIAYCLMLQHGGRVLQSYWHYIMMPPRRTPETPLVSATQTIRRPFGGIAWTVLAVGSALRDRVRLRTPTLPLAR